LCCKSRKSNNPKNLAKTDPTMSAPEGKTDLALKSADFRV
jgi:hypothetical protein